MSLSDQDILKLWRDPSFPGSYRGVRTFQILLKTDLNIDIPETRLLKVLKSDPIYLIHQKPQRNFERRHYYVHFYGQLVQMDIAFMFKDPKSNYNNFLLAIDVYSFKIFTVPLKTKSSQEVAEAVKKVFDEFGQPIYEIQTDRGTEFRNKILKNFLIKQHTFIKFKFGQNKASVAEYAILLVKRKLYMQLRATLSNEWSAIIEQVTQNLNNTPLKRLGWKTPNSIHSEADSVAVDKAKNIHNIPNVSLPSYEEQKTNEKSYVGDLKVGDFVYIDFDEKVFDKSFDVSVKVSVPDSFYQSLSIFRMNFLPSLENNIKFISKTKILMHLNIKAAVRYGRSFCPRFCCLKERK